MNRINKTNNIDPMAEARKLKDFDKYSKEAEERIRLAEEVYRRRKELNLSQTELAKRAETTQRIISDIENADLNIGFALLNRLARELSFDCENWSNALEFNAPGKTYI
jgi:ribosome-binding protein aMBF1 (putative translation factor)